MARLRTIGASYHDPKGYLGPPIKEPNHEHEILTGGIAARRRDVNYSRGENARTWRSAASLRKQGGPRGCCSALERRLHDRPRPNRMRRAHVGLWQPPRAFTIPERVLISAG